MKETSKCRDSILAQLDESAQDFRFPDLEHGYSYTIDARLHGYADTERWALIVEVVGYNPRAGQVDDVLHTYGNCLTLGRPGFENDDFLARIDNFDEVEDPDEPETASGAAVVVRGRRIDLQAQSGEELSAVFRRSVPTHRDLLLADPDELRRRIPPDLPEVLRLEEWHQHNVHATKPSESQVYLQVADVLATGDPDQYRPTLPPNTPWSNWPESGGL